MQCVGWMCRRMVRALPTAMWQQHDKTDALLLPLMNLFDILDTLGLLTLAAERSSASSYFNLVMKRHIGPSIFKFGGNKKGRQTQQHRHPLHTKGNSDLHCSQTHSKRMDAITIGSTNSVFNVNTNSNISNINSITIPTAVTTPVVAGSRKSGSAAVAAEACSGFDISAVNSASVQAACRLRSGTGDMSCAASASSRSPSPAASSAACASSVAITAAYPPQVSPLDMTTSTSALASQSPPVQTSTGPSQAAVHLPK
eukprot:GHVT01081140.1.p1 GENE.GHVT01081140.1~~GHVT01081140.1.p1  ORF type:complete len:256 (-),score=44.10 GHVT01081140.1:2729-3496(-)